MRQIIKKKMIGYVYKINCKCGCNHFYIGSCSIELRERLRKHKNASNRRKYKFYQHMKKVGISNFEISLLEQVDYCHRDELRMKETEYYDMLNPFFNTKRPFMMECEQRDKNSENEKNHRNKHAEHNRLRKQKYYLKNKNKINNRVKLYTLKHSKQRKEYARNYRAKNQEKINEYRKKKIKTLKELNK